VTKIRRDVSEMTVKPIGWVKNDVDAPMMAGWDKVTSDIVLETDLVEATAGLSEFSHVIIVFWMHQMSSWTGQPLKIHPRARPDLPLVGLFASRSPRRPNAIGISVVPLLGCQGNILRVKGLDAINGTPVLDVKPYTPRDLVSEAQWPAWMARL
jgi:tRNA-Thr(GGU) m(6)t(6)A37 methyltransferase TsaA